jgi:hypothetical protein
MAKKLEEVKEEVLYRVFDKRANLVSQTDNEEDARTVAVMFEGFYKVVE